MSSGFLKIEKTGNEFGAKYASVHNQRVDVPIFENVNLQGAERIRSGSVMVYALPMKIKKYGSGAPLRIIIAITKHGLQVIIKHASCIFI